MLYALYVCCLHVCLNALQATFNMEANTMNPYQTAHKGKQSDLDTKYNIIWILF